MAGEYNAQFPSHILLHPFDRIVFEFDDFATLFANEMVVVMLTSDFVARLVFIKVTLGQEFTFLEQFERSVDGCVTDVRIDFLYFGIEFFRTHMPTQFEKDTGNIVPW